MTPATLPRVVSSGPAISYVEPVDLPTSHLRTVIHIADVWTCDCLGFAWMGACSHVLAVQQHQAGQP